MKKTLLVVHHTVSPSMHALYLAAMDGACDPSIDGVEVVARPALAATAVDVLAADGYLLASPVNLGYLSGTLKHFFDQIYYPCLDATRRRPFLCTCTPTTTPLAPSGPSTPSSPGWARGRRRPPWS